MFNSPITSFLALKSYLEAQQFKGWGLKKDIAVKRT